MKNINEIIDAAKIGGGYHSDYALAKAIDRPPSLISSMRSGRRWPVLSDTTQFAHMIGMEPAELFLCVEAIRTGDKTLIGSAQRMLQKLHSKAAGIGGLCMGFQVVSEVSAHTECALCILC